MSGQIRRVIDVNRATGPIAVLGATGAQGGAVAAALRHHGLPVRAVVRNPTAQRARALADAGADVVVADLADEQALATAFTGTAGVFAVTTPFEEGPEAEVEQGLHILAAAERAAVPHLVFSSVAGADQRSGVPHFESKAAIEAALARSAVPHTIVGPTYFFDNLLGGGEQLDAGVLELALPADLPLQQLDRRDLGAFVAHVCAEPEQFIGRRIDLASDTITPHQMARALQRALGRPIRVVSPDPADIASADMRAMYTFLTDRGYAADTRWLHRTYPDIGWHRFDDWLDDTLSADREG
ncbi:NmrA/HSCARG family protein [Mycolicibacterium sp. 120266]|uniref:NmrA/HSCARG family protein n=1 Tax=Mycolicibacterium sp. 120266 TaxID=3090601 RepID=UPI00299D8DF5|nr:NmrA/HSCARG family protein [Mycolicibacterium sp. 120266]MDX1871634.1 NmrA/HSCARG family protein [Mycolicibacterium sp. 120266]